MTDIQEFKDRNTVVVGVSLDSPESNKAFQAKFDFPYDLLCDTDKVMSIAYGAAAADASHASRVSYLIDAEGKVLKAYRFPKPGRLSDPVCQHKETLSDLRWIDYRPGSGHLSAMMCLLGPWAQRAGALPVARIRAKPREITHRGVESRSAWKSAVSYLYVIMAVKNIGWSF